MEKEGTGTTYKIQAGDAYVFDNHESHYIRGGPDGAKIICIFTPACTGKEVSISTSFQKSSGSRDLDQPIIFNITEC